MDIVGEVERRYPTRGEYPTEAQSIARMAFATGAEWARKEALKEAEDALENLPGSDATGYYSSEQHAGYQDAQDHAERAVRALMEREF